MESKGFKRKLTAILSADVVSYSRLMRDDEEATVHTLNTYKDMISDLIERNRGRLVDSTGDNLLAEFASVVDAVRCAVQIQEDLKVQNDESPDNRKMDFRIGINLGDVIQEGKRIYGDGVNVAARIEALADAGGICIARNAYDQVKKKLNLRYDYLGEHHVKNIDEPVRVYKVLMETGAGEVPKEDRPREPASVDRMSYPLPNKPSIAVLPFVNMSNNTEQEFLCDGITEDIITILSKNPELLVIARNSVFTYKGKPVKIQQVSEDLGVRYVLEGSLQKVGDRVRITTQLIDALTGTHIWAERYDLDLIDIFSLQDKISMHIFEAMALKFTTGLRVKQASKGTKSLNAYLMVVEGQHYLDRFTPDSLLQAKKLFEDAIALDSDYASAYIFLALALTSEVLVGFADSPKKSITEASELIEKAQALDSSDPSLYQVSAVLHLVKRQHDEALTNINYALELMPNHSMSLYVKGNILIYMGRPEEALAVFKKQLRIDPIKPYFALLEIGWANLRMGTYEEALINLKKVVEINPAFLLGFTVILRCYMAIEREDEAHAVAEEILRLEPDFSSKKFVMSLPYKDQTVNDRMLKSYLKAGLPE